MNSKSTELTPKDYAEIAFQGVLKGIPVVGASLEHFIFGPLAEIRMRRIEGTLTELTEHYGPRQDPALLAKEEFVNLLEDVLVPLSRATNETKRQRFRDLLINAAELPPGAEQWENARLASNLLQSIDAPGLAILAAMARCHRRYPLILTPRPIPQIYEGDKFDYDNPEGPDHPLPYEWTLIEEWARRLRDMRLISFQTQDGRGGFGGAQLAELGLFLVKWAMTDKSKGRI
jgi:hypothetical protein